MSRKADVSKRTTLPNIGAEPSAPGGACPSDFGIDISFEGHWVVARIRGDLDVATAPTLRSVLDGLVSAGHLLVSLDLRAVSLMSAAGLTVLAGTARRLEAIGGLVLESVPPHVARVLDVCGLGHLRAVAASPGHPPGRPRQAVADASSRSASRVPFDSKKETAWASS